MAGLKIRCIDSRPYLGTNKNGQLKVGPMDGEMISLTVGKIYDVIDEDDEFYRIVDDTGEDYLYPKYMFKIEEL